MTKLNGINLNGLQVSDLFFNHEKQTYETVNRDHGTQEEIKAIERGALMQDAKDFSEMIGNQVTPEALVEDFMARV